jgi:transcription antitermination factor NusG
MQHWYALYVNARHEKKIVLKLLEQRIEAYTPIARKIQQWSDRKQRVEFPMLSGYIFVKTDLTDKEKILHTPSILGFIKFNGTEASIRESEINILKSIELTGYDITQEVSDLKMSDDVEIMQGPLKGLAGKIVRIQNEDYISIELNSIKQSIRVKVPKHIIKILAN